MGSLEISEGNIARRKKKKNTHPEYVPNHNYQWRSNSDAHICQQQVGAGQGGMDCIISLLGKEQA